MASVVAIGSKNPVKFNAVKESFGKCFPNAEFEFVAIDTKSGVSDQPMGDQETRQGAINRAKNLAKQNKTFKFTVGLEGGCGHELFSTEHQIGNDSLSCFAWMAIYDLENDKWGFARTGSFTLPDPIAELVKGGMELGHADDLYFERSNSKQKDGAVGILTNGLIDRQAYYEHALILALTPFMAHLHK